MFLCVPRPDMDVYLSAVTGSKDGQEVSSLEREHFVEEVSAFIEALGEWRREKRWERVRGVGRGERGEGREERGGERREETGERGENEMTVDEGKKGRRNKGNKGRKEEGKKGRRDEGKNGRREIV